jgi:hypothetical protein
MTKLACLLAVALTLPFAAFATESTATDSKEAPAAAEAPADANAAAPADANAPAHAAK